MKLNSSLDIKSSEHKTTINICVKYNPYHNDTLFLAEIDFEKEIIRLFRSYHSCFSKPFTLLGVSDYLKVMEKWEHDDYTDLPFETFAEFMEKQFEALSSTFSEIVKLTVGFGYGKQITKKIIPLIKPQYKQNAYMDIVRNAKSKNSIVINLDNNPWRNGLVQGEILFAIIKADGKAQYMLFKNKYFYYFDKLNIEYTANLSEQNEDMIRINLPDFKQLLDNPTEDFIQAINSIYINNIAFPAFGCCAKFKECATKNECIHSDRLYSTACQYRKIIERSDLNANS